MMEDGDRNTIHGTAEISTGNREDLFKPTVTETLVNIVCGGCGDMFSDHWAWEEHIRDMVELEDTDHNFVTQVMDGEDPNVVLDGAFECPDCGNGYASEEHRDNHRMTIGTSVRLVCSQCASLVPDMEKHLPRHKSDVKCGECGGAMRNLHDHMLQKHRKLDIHFAQRHIYYHFKGIAKFLASEVKPFEPEEPEKLNNNKPQSAVKRKQQDDSEIFNISHSAFSLDDEFLVDANAINDPSDANFTPKKKKIKKQGTPPNWPTTPESKDLDKSDLTEYMSEFGMSERDRALCPPPYLPTEFFDGDGVRLWLKLQSRKGFHQCELCGFLAKTKNKYREKQDHLMKWHFSRRIDEILPSTGKKPFHCPLCEFLGKDRQCVVRHYTGKHQALDVWMGEFMDSLTSKTITEDILLSVENVDILAKPGQLQKPGRGKIVNSVDDMKTFLSESYDENQTKKSYSCEICLKEFPSNGALNSHNLIDHSDKTRSEMRNALNFRGQESEELSVEVDTYLEDEEMEADEGDALILENGEGGSIRCITCSNSKEAKLKSVIELKDHIQNNHMDLCRLDYFVLCQSRDSNDESKSFNYTMCCICGKCFSQSSTDEALREHARDHLEMTK